MVNRTYREVLKSKKRKYLFLAFLGGTVERGQPLHDKGRVKQRWIDTCESRQRTCRISLCPTKGEPRVTESGERKKIGEDTAQAQGLVAKTYDHDDWRGTQPSERMRG